MAGSSQGTPCSGPMWNQDSDTEDEPSSEVDDAIEEMDDQPDDMALLQAGVFDNNFHHVPYPNVVDVVKGKDGQTDWSNVPPPSGRRLRVNIWKPRDGKFGVRTSVPRVNSAIQPALDNTPAAKLSTFKLMVTDEMLDSIVAFTNAKARAGIEALNIANPNSEQQDWTDVDRVEITAFIGLLYLAGAHRLKRESTYKLWRSDERYKRHPFAATMARQRFHDIMQYLRFDDLTTREARRERDKLTAIREFCDAVQTNLFEIYEPQDQLVVDEMLVKFRGRCPFRVYMKSKPGRYGIKIWALVDAKTRFVCNYQVYLGKEGENPEVNQGKRVLHDMVSPYYGSWRVVTADNFFGSKVAAEELMSHQITSVFTIRANRRELPKELTDKDVTRKLALYTSKFLLNDNSMLVCYKAKENKTVLLISTQHQAPLVHKSEPFKPEIIYHYNATKGGVDTVDQMKGEYSTLRGTNRWPNKIFMEILDFVGLNSLILWDENNSSWMKGRKSRRQLFLENLAEEMIMPLIKRRSVNGLQKHIVTSMLVMGASLPVQTKPQPGSPRGYCHVCVHMVENPDIPGTKRVESLRTRVKCDTCENFTCENHIQRKKICNFCQPPDV